ncbi:anthranilate synthase component II [Halobacillus alkaliphilus]|nr:aminodeoxychorismate/anthranilate synthase component II [Halobacillus alkaliphilus]
MILILDNYDSFTYNLVQYFKQIHENVKVYRNDQISIEGIKDLNPDFIVLSPGPGSPKETGICRDVLKQFHQTTPILGICLGHQLIVNFFGGKVREGGSPMHGKVTKINHDGDTVFRNIPAAVQVTRYHSLHTPPEELPPMLEVSAVSQDGVVMAVRHRNLPIEGIQFHPESIMTDYGFQMLINAYQSAISKSSLEMEGALQ